MSQPTKRSTDKSKTKIIPPKKKKEENLSKDEVRYLNKKRVKRKRRAKKIFTGAVFACAIVAVFILLALTVVFKIETIKIQGAKLYDDKVVIQKSGISIGDGLFAVSEDKLNEVLPSNLPYIKNIEIRRQLPSTLIIEIFSTRETAAFTGSDGYILVDETGKVLDTKAQMLRDNVAFVSGAKVKSSVPGQIIELQKEAQTETFLTILKGLNESEIKDITEISIDKKGAFRLVYQDRIKIELGNTDNLLVKLERGKLAIDKENAINPYSEGVLNLADEPNAYFSPGEEEEVTIAYGYVTDKHNNLVTDEYGQIVTIPVSGAEDSEKAEE